MSRKHKFKECREWLEGRLCPHCFIRLKTLAHELVRLSEKEVIILR